MKGNTGQMHHLFYFAVLTPEEAMERYQRVLLVVKKGNTKSAAYDLVGVDRKTVVDTAPISELNAADAAAYKEMRTTMRRGETLSSFSNRCKARIVLDGLEGKVEEMKKAGTLLEIYSRASKY